jgi:hypothetical protein
VIDPRYLDDAVDLLIQARQEATEATRRAEAAEERCKALGEALRALVATYHDPTCLNWRPGRTDTGGSGCGRCVAFDRARALLEES